eukprot:gnl/TRDRNA2_/TRDRNA2_27883_c0_seq1.p1 gnl/TRDRNA2_/TRDRNA2_27883_c0~~gnl/TRDRNA2_/TRDRNA2_27883_c0_seq1.p1  ORF type:complete len:252 (+),score=45.51 gnl/TRDRNA2_/TRDRNA2_27883_c0_seq1:123-878(+)
MAETEQGNEPAVATSIPFKDDYRCGEERGPAPKFSCDFEETPDGEYIWNASRALLWYLQAPETHPSLRGKRVLELGSGLGHLGYGIARLGAHVTCTEQAKGVPILEASLAELQKQHGAVGVGGAADIEVAPSESGVPMGSLRCLELEWGEQGVAGCPLAAENASFDFIISSELVYLEETHDLLVWTLQRFCAPHTVVYSVFINRPFSWAFFAKMHDTNLFEVEQLEEDVFNPCGLEECYAHRVTRKPISAE